MNSYRAMPNYITVFAGAMSALVTVATLLGFNVGNSLLNATYGLTVGLYPETVFIIAIIVDIAGVILIG